MEAKSASAAESIRVEAGRMVKKRFKSRKTGISKIKFPLYFEGSDRFGGARSFLFIGFNGRIFIYPKCGFFDFRAIGFFVL